MLVPDRAQPHINRKSPFGFTLIELNFEFVNICVGLDISDKVINH